MPFIFFTVIRGLNKNVDLRNFENLIFDLGGVIINLDEERTIEAFVGLSHLSASTVREEILKFEEYHLLEKGLISAREFREVLRTKFEITASDQQIDSSLNAMLLDIPMARIELLKSLNKFSLYLLSNTNIIHLTRFNQIFKETTGEDKIDGCFKRAYYSHEIHLRKPDRKIFEWVLKENGLIPEKTLFLDDNRANLEGASSVGIHTFHVESPSQLFDLFQ